MVFEFFLAQTFLNYPMFFGFLLRKISSRIAVFLSAFISIANDECPEAFELYSSLNPNTMDRREACGQPDEQYQTLYRGAPVYDTLEPKPSQVASNPIYER
ncbi:unnamed protein product, partial [Porites lobata]